MAYCLTLISRQADMAPLQADAMLRTLTLLTDVTRPPGQIREFAGYTQEELLRGKPGVVVKIKNQIPPR